MNRIFTITGLSSTATGATPLWLVLCGIAVLTFGMAADRAATPPPATSAAPAAQINPRDYANFKPISDKNIFNTARSRRSAGGAGDEKKPKPTDVLTLVGVLRYEKGPFAFFDGSSGDYRKVLEPGKTIAGYKITDISPSSVKLESGTNTVDLRIGMEMRREEDGEWQVSGGGPAASAAASSSSSSSDSAPGDESDIVKRLMKQREQELK